MELVRGSVANIESASMLKEVRWLDESKEHRMRWDICYLPWAFVYSAEVVVRMRWLGIFVGTRNYSVGRKQRKLVSMKREEVRSGKQDSDYARRSLLSEMEMSACKCG